MLKKVLCILALVCLCKPLLSAQNAPQTAESNRAAHSRGSLRDASVSRGSLRDASVLPTAALPRVPLSPEMKINRRKSWENKDNHAALRKRFDWVAAQNQRLVKDGVQFITPKKPRVRKDHKRRSHATR